MVNLSLLALLMILVQCNLWYVNAQCTDRPFLEFPDVHVQEAKFPNDATSCVSLGILEISAVGKMEKGVTVGRVDSKTGLHQDWTYGHYPYETAAIQGGVLESAKERLGCNPPAILTVADKAYQSVLEPWAHAVMSVNVSACIVLALDVVICHEAERVGCRCMKSYEEGSNSVYGDSNVKQGWHKARRDGVKNRFLGALSVMKSGVPVVMHDADVFFLPHGLSHLLTFIQATREQVPGLDILAQNNGRRETAFDDINWGFSWIAPSEPSMNILECTLALWDHHVFEAPHGAERDSYYLRSQPRINHITELAIKQNVAPPTIRLFPSDVFLTSVRHMTGYHNTNQKIHCGKAFGLLKMDTDRVLGYEVPPSAEPELQRVAFAAALELAESLDRKVAMPAVYYNGHRIPFCMMFHLDSRTFTHEHRLTGALGDFVAKEKTTTVGVCASKEVSLARSTAAHDLLCLSFDELTQKRTETVKTVHLCNPSNPAYRSSHASNCGIDEI